MLKKTLDIIGRLILKISFPHPPRWNIEKICIIIWGGIGDGILFLPSLIAIKKKFKDKKIYSIIQRKELAVLYDDYSITVYRDGFENSDIRGFFRIFLSLKKIRPDIVISNAPNPEFLSGFIPYIAGAKLRIAPRESNRGFLINKPLINPDGHDIDRNIRLLRLLNIYDLEKSVKFNVKKFHFKMDCFKIGIHTGSARGMYYKRWDKENFLELVNLLSDRFCIILLGTDEEKDEIYYILNNVKKNKNFWGFIKTKDLKELISVLKGLDLIISNDSLISHLSSMLKKPVITIFGPSDEKRYGPFGKYSYIIKSDIECRPCNRKKQPRCKDLKCLKEIKVNEVYEKTISLYNILHTYK